MAWKGLSVASTSRLMADYLSNNSYVSELRISLLK